MRSMRFLFSIPLLALGACTPGETNQAGNAVAPAEPAAVGSAQSAAEGQAIAEEQAELADNGLDNASAGRR